MKGFFIKVGGVKNLFFGVKKGKTMDVKETEEMVKGEKVESRGEV